MSGFFPAAGKASPASGVVGVAKALGADVDKSLVFVAEEARAERAVRKERARDIVVVVGGHGGKGICRVNSLVRVSSRSRPANHIPPINATKLSRSRYM